MTDIEVRVEACLRALLPEGSTSEFTIRQLNILDMSGDWRECVDERGEEHPATRGCLLALVREALGCPSLRCGHEGGWDDGWDRWGVGNPPGKGHGCIIASAGCATEDEALVVALEAWCLASA